jgi:hypothetical protein
VLILNELDKKRKSGATMNDHNRIHWPRRGVDLNGKTAPKANIGTTKRIAPVWKCITFGLIVLAVFSTLTIASVSAAETYGAEDSNPTGNPIGGGAGYTDMIEKTDPRVKFVVSTTDQFLDALKSAGSGDVIYIEGTATIDLTGTYTGVTIPAGVTIASNRGENGSLGGKIVQNAKNDPTNLGGQCALKAAGEGVRLTGLRLEGPHKTTVEEKALKRGFVSSYKNTEVDNCEIWGWSYAGVNVGSGTTYAAHIHHNYIHHCQREGYGYGILNGGVTLVEANIFDHCRHAVADGGSTSHFYEARYNTFNPGYTSRVLDMHGEGSKYCGSIYAHHNTFMDTTIGAARIRAVPQKTAYFEYNWYLMTKGAAIEQKNGNANIKNTNNAIGPDKKVEAVCAIKQVEYNGKTEKPISIAATAKPAMLPPLRPYPTSSGVQTSNLSQNSTTVTNSAPLTAVNASFAASITRGIAPITVQFNDTSMGSPNTWLWSFGDGNFSMEQNPTYTYQQPGDYTVNLFTGNGETGDIQRAIEYIHIASVPPQPA